MSVLPGIRRKENPVTHAMEVTILDAPQLALERVVAAMDRELLRLNAADGDRLLAKLVAVIAIKRPYTETPA